MSELQNFILPKDIIQETELFYRGEGAFVSDDILNLHAGTVIRTDTYFNLFDAATWERYTGLTEFELVLSVKGEGSCELWFTGNEADGEDGDRKVQEISFNCNAPKKIQMDFKSLGKGYFYQILRAEKPVQLLSMAVTSSESVRNEVSLGINICTYHREDQVKNNLAVLENSRFFKKDSKLFGKMRIVVVDNGSALSPRKEEYLRIVHNKNTGGSGGFARGIRELDRWNRELKQSLNLHLQKDAISHVVFMDDDVEFLEETFYRQYALLSYILPEYKNEVIAGRMFRLDDKKIQYTASEIWNHSDIQHVGFMLDMTKEENLLSVNETNGEYSGWWMAVFPMEFASQNEPIPFFIHCDDVEYGLRHGGTPIILNGIEVWHETFEYRQNDIIAYYDYRNSRIVNDLYGRWRPDADPLREWKEAISKLHVEGRYQEEYILILAFQDYIKGVSWLKKIDPEKNHKRIRQAKTGKVRSALRWRLVEQSYKKKYNKPKS